MLRTDFVVDLMVFYRYVYLHSGSCEDECHNSKHQVEAISSGTENSVSELVVRVVSRIMRFNKLLTYWFPLTSTTPDYTH